MSHGRMVPVGLILGSVAAAALTAVAPVRTAMAVGVFSLIAIAASRWREVPKWTLYAVLAMVPLDALTRVGGGTTLTKIVFPVGFGALVIDRVLSRRPLVWSRLCGWVAAFGASVLLSFVVNPDGGFARHSLNRYVGVLLLFFLAVQVTETLRDARRVLVAVVLSCVVSVLGGLLVQAGWLRIAGLAVHNGLHGTRLMGLSTYNPNTFATYLLAAALPCAYFLAVEKRLVWRGVLAAVLFVLLIGIARSLSRAVLLVAVLCIPLLWWEMRRLPGAWRSASLLVLLVVLLLPLVPSEYYLRVQSLIRAPATDLPFLQRQSFNRVAWELFISHPLLGVGPGGFSRHFTSEEFRFLADTFGPWKMVHNLYLAIACHMGLVGVVFFAGVVWQAFGALRFAVRREAEPDELTHAARALRLALWSLLMNAFFLPAEHEKYLWVAFALATALANMRQRMTVGNGV